MGSYLLLTPVFLPVLAGILLLCLPKWKNRKLLCAYVAVCLIGTGLLVLTTLFKEEISCTLFYLTKDIPIYFHVDSMGKIFAAVVTIVFTASGIYALEYMKGSDEKRFFGFYLILFGVLIALDFAGNLVTFYFFYELMTLVSVPLVIHDLKKESIMAALKYLFYSLCGAYMVLFGTYFLYHYGTSLTFGTKSILDSSLVMGNETILLIAVFSMIMGFSVKAGMFPLHGWLSSAHPVAPAPASAVLSGVIVKAGVLGIIRVIFYLVGPDFIRGTWVQYTWLTLTLITVFMGSMLAYREKGLKKRLAYSTVSQVSYILFGLALLTPIGFTGSVLHVIFHAFIKCSLFLIAGAIIHKTGKANVGELTGIGKEMPITMWCFTIASLALIGIPPTAGFISKWYLAIAAFDSSVSVFSWLGPVVLLISALLTAGYLLPITIKGFFPGEHYDYGKLVKKEPVLKMIIPILVLVGLAVWLGMFPNPLTSFILETAARFVRG